MNGRGLDPRIRVAGWALFALAIAAVILLTGQAALDAATGWLANEHDRLPWYATRLIAMLSYLAITGSVAWGLLLSTGILDAISHRAVSFTLHQDLSGIGLGLAMVHAAILAIDRSVPFTPLQVLVPFMAPWHWVWVGVGQVALWLAVVVMGSFYVRRRIGQKRWRTIHYLAFLAWLGATAHGLMIGTDRGAPWAWAIYVASGSIVAFLFAYRIVLAVAPRIVPSVALPTARTARTVTGGPAAPGGDAVR